MNYLNMQTKRQCSINYPKLLELTSLQVEEFMYLLYRFDICCKTYFRLHDLSGSFRRIPKYIEDARSSLPDSSRKLYFILTYLKENPNQQYHGELFGMSQSRVSKWVNLLIPILEKALAYLKVVPKRLSHELYVVLKNLGEMFVLMDATEREIPRSVNYERQKFEYSGKKRTHTIKNNLITNDSNRILYLSDSYEGSAHDKRIADEAELQFPDNSYLVQDLGYIGFDPDNVTVLMAQKNYKRNPLSSYEQEINWLIGKIRVQVEHVMAGIKRLKIVKEKIRLKNDHIKDKVMVIACALHNLRIEFRNNNKKSE